MLIARAVSTAARRSTTSSNVVSNLSQRGFAVAASSQQFHDQRAEPHFASAHVGKLLFAAAAAAGLCPSIVGGKSADCCGIAGVVGGSGDAR
jgi:hypothetical protein